MVTKNTKDTKNKKAENKAESLTAVEMEVLACLPSGVGLGVSVPDLADDAFLNPLAAEPQPQLTEAVRRSHVRAALARIRMVLESQVDGGGLVLTRDLSAPVGYQRLYSVSGKSTAWIKTLLNSALPAAGS